MGKNALFKHIETFVKIAVDRYTSHGVGKTCAALAYYFLFSAFPFLVFFSMLLSFLDIEPISITSDLGTLLPSGVLDVVNGYLTHVDEARDMKLMLFGLVFTLYFMIRAVSFLMQGVRCAYGVPEPKSVVKRCVFGALYTLFVIVLLIVSIVLIIAGGSLMGFLGDAFGLSDGFIQVWSALRFIVLAVLLFTLLSVLYKTAPLSGGYPAGTKPRRVSVIPGSVAALAAWLIFSTGFAWYTDNMASYSLLYGSIGAIIVTLLWLYFSAVVIVMGAEINSMITESKNTIQGELDDGTD